MLEVPLRLTQDWLGEKLREEECDHENQGVLKVTGREEPASLHISDD